MFARVDRPALASLVALFVCGLHSLKKNCASMTQTLVFGQKGMPKKEVCTFCRLANVLSFDSATSVVACRRSFFDSNSLCVLMNACDTFFAGREEYIAFLEATVASKMKAALKDRRKRVRKATKEFDALVHKLMENVRLLLFGQGISPNQRCRPHAHNEANRETVGVVSVGLLPMLLRMYPVHELSGGLVASFSYDPGSATFPQPRTHRSSPFGV